MSVLQLPASAVVGEPIGIRQQSLKEELPVDGERQRQKPPAKASRKSLVNTDSLDGLRALAVMHIVLGHFGLYTDWTGIAGDDFSDGFDLVGGVSIGLFFLISGFVLMIGYGSADEAPAPSSRWCDWCDLCCWCFCSASEEEPPSTMSGPSPLEAPRVPVAPTAFDTRAFYWKRFARLMPLWYLGNLLCLPLYFVGYLPAGEWTVRLVLSLPPLGLNSLCQLFPPAFHLWTISTMMTFYILFPALYPCARRVRPDKLWSFAMVLYCIQILLTLIGGLGVTLLRAVHFQTGELRLDGDATESGYWFARSWPLNRLPLFVMGLCAARQSELEELDPALYQTCCGVSCCSCSVSKGLKAWLILGIFFIVVGLGIAEQLVGGSMLNLPSDSAIVRSGGEMVLPVVLYELLLAVAYPASAPRPPSRLHAFLGSRPLRFLADISLGLYVVHDPLIRYVALVLRGPAEPAPDGSMSESWRMPIWGPLPVLPLSLVVGWAATRFFEKPMQRVILKQALRKA